MILYCSISTSPKSLERHADKVPPAGLGGNWGVDNFLFSFFQPDARECARYFCRQPQRRLFIDSGAYTAWSKGTPVDINDYIVFCKAIQKHAKCPVTFAGLDVIAKHITDDALETAAKQSLDNCMRIRAKGIPCLMTFHMWEDPKWLKLIIEDKDSDY